jgi:hypothetical protein
MKTRTKNLFLALASLRLLVMPAAAQDFIFNGVSAPGETGTYGGVENPFLFGSLSDGIHTFAVDNLDDDYFPYNYIYNDCDNGFGFSITNDSIVTITATAGLNIQEVYALNLRQGADQAGGAGGADGYTTLSFMETLTAGSYLLYSHLIVPLAPPEIYEDAFSGSIRVESVPTMSIGNATVAEGENGTTNAIFTISLSKPCSQTVTVFFHTADGTANSYNQYDLTGGTVTFTPGQTNQTVAVTVNGGGFSGVPEENFYANLSSPVNTDIAMAQGIGTILNEDYPPAFQSVTQTNGTIQFTWSTVPGQICQLQSNTNLNSTNWLNLGDSITATNTTASASDSITNSQCFYRILLVQ